VQQGAFDTLIKADATTDDTLALIVSTAKDYSKHGFAQECAKLLCPPGTDRDTCLRNVFNYYCRNVKYILDQKGIEKVYTPARTISEGEGDCKKAATYIASVLLATGRPDLVPVFKWVLYSGNDEFSHIYVIVPINGSTNNYVTLDPTNNCQYDKEVKYNNGTLYFVNGKKMELRQMGYSDNEMKGRFNIPWSNHINEGTSKMTNDLEQISLPGIGAASSKAIKLPVPAAHKAIVAKLTQGKPQLAASLNNIPLVNQRGAFLQLIKTNSGGIASNLVQVLAKKPDALNALWKTIGGDETHLKQMILAGSKVKAASISGAEYIGAMDFQGYQLVVNGNPIDLNGVTLGVLNEYMNIHQIPKDLQHDYDALQNLAANVVHGSWVPPLPAPGDPKLPAPAHAKKTLLQAAAGVLNVIAPIANAIIPGAGAVLNGLADNANKAQAVVDSVNAAAIVPSIPQDPTGVNDTSQHFKGNPKGGTSHGSTMGSIYGGMFTGTMLIYVSHYHFGIFTTNIIAGIWQSALLVFTLYQWKIKKHNLLDVISGEYFSFH
jgi:hypothetical protein